MTADGYEFVPVAMSDLPLLRKWLDAPHVRSWWGEPDHEIELIRQDIDDDRMVNCIVGLAGRSFAYVQHYDVHAWPQEHLGHLPPASRAIDTFIGETSMLGGGHDVAYLRQLAQQLYQQGAPEVAIDPDIRNIRAQRAFERAGFKPARRVDASQGTAMLMLFSPD